MKFHLYLSLLALLSFAAPALAQVPTIVSPANGATGVATANPAITMRSTSTDHDNTGEETLNVEICINSSFTGATYWSSSPDITRTSDSPTNYPVVGPNSLQAGTLYYIRATSDVWGDGPTTTFTTASSAITEINRVAKVNGINASTTTGPLSCIPNDRYLTFDLSSALTNATQYVIQFDTTSANFTNVIDSIVFTATSQQLKVDIGGIAGKKLSGQTVFVRSHGRNPSSNGPFGAARRFVWPLQPCKLVTPTGTISRTGFKLWTNGVLKGSKYYFQVDDDPTFASPNTLTGSFASLNRTVTGIPGNVFEANYTVGGTGRAFNYLSQLTPSITYYVRVRGWNSTQNGYWADTMSITPQPTLTAGFTNITNNQTGVSVSSRLIFRDDPNYTETRYEFQLSTVSNFSSTVVNQTNLTTRSYFNSNLLYGTTYYARVRSYVNSASSAWSTIQFTTQTLPAPFVTFPTNGTVWPNPAVYAYCSWEGPITQYDWEVERLTAPGATFSGSSTTFGRNFSAFLQRGKNYRIRVRGNASTQSLTGNWSAWVTFSVANSGPLPAVVDNAREDEETAPATTALTEPLAYPNPFTAQVMLALPEGAVSYSVTDISGRLVETASQVKPVQEVGAGWPRGTYLVSVGMAAGPAKRLRIVKQ